MLTFCAKIKKTRDLVHILSTYYVLARSIHVAVKLGLPSLIDAKETKLTQIHAALAKQQLITQPKVEPLQRLLKFLASYGIFSARADRVLATGLSQALSSKRVQNNL